MVDSDSRDDDYLWARRGRPDRDIEHLERLLAPFALRADDRAVPRAQAHGARRAAPLRRRRRRHVVRALLMAACIAIALGVGVLHLRLSWPSGRAWNAQLVTGAASIDGHAIRGGTLLPLGGVLRTAARSAVRIDAARLGHVVVGADSEVELVATRSGHHRLRLVHGRLKANIWAPGFAFGVATPSVDAYDLGCEFVLSMAQDGTGSLRVERGWVMLSAGERQSLIPQGAQADVMPGFAPGTPYDLGATPAFRAALHAIDAAGTQVSGDDPALAQLVREARKEDAISLVSLLTRHPQLADSIVYDRAVAAIGAPHGLTREAIRRRDGSVLDDWWNRLPYPRVKSWWMRWPDVLEGVPDAASLERDGLL